MHVEIPPEMEEYIQAKVGMGSYGDVSGVVREAIRRMREEDKQVEALRAAVAIGDEQIDQGKGVVFTPELMDQIMTEAIVNAKLGKPVNPDVMP